MPVEPYNPQGRPDISRDEYRRYQEEKARRRKKRRLQKLLLVGAFIIGAALLVLCIVMIFKGLFKSKDPASSTLSGTPASVVSTAQPEATGPLAADPEAWNLKIISPAYPADAGFAVQELATLAYGGVGYYIDARISDTLAQMITDCNGATGGSLKIISGYRSYNFSQKQYIYFYNNYKKQGLTDEQAAAKAAEHEVLPGTNEHQTALAVDFITNAVKTPATGFDQTAEYQWLRENCANYGFVLRYASDKTAITGVEYQPYHFRYVGVEDAKVMTENNLCLEEYVGKAAQPEPQPAASTGSEEGSTSVAP